MGRFDRIVLQRIEKHQDEFTSIERQIGDFFTKNQEIVDFSSKAIAARLYVSEASLSRFAKKCGYKGFREFVYHYVGEYQALSIKPDINIMTRRVLDQYQELLDKSFGLVDEQQMHRISQLFSASKEVLVYGKGSSGIAAQEFALRFMRLGVHIHAETDTHVMKMTSALAGEGVLTIGISIGGGTQELLRAMDIAGKRGSRTLLITASQEPELIAGYDEVLHVASTKNLEKGTTISPQFPVLVMADIFYSYFMNTDFFYKSSRYTDTLSALFQGQEWNGVRYSGEEDLN